MIRMDIKAPVWKFHELEPSGFATYDVLSEAFEESYLRVDGPTIVCAVRLLRRMLRDYPEARIEPVELACQLGFVMPGNRQKLRGLMERMTHHGLIEPTSGTEFGLRTVVALIPENTAARAQMRQAWFEGNERARRVNGAGL